jgi:large subunit ribosomal protein L29
MTNAKEFREMAADTLGAKVKEMETDLFNARLQANLGKLENTGTLREVRRDIARAKTVLAQKLKETLA